MAKFETFDCDTIREPDVRFLCLEHLKLREEHDSTRVQLHITTGLSAAVGFILLILIIVLIFKSIREKKQAKRRTVEFPPTYLRNSVYTPPPFSPKVEGALGITSNGHIPPRVRFSSFKNTRG